MFTTKNSSLLYLFLQESFQFAEIRLLLSRKIRPLTILVNCERRLRLKNRHQPSFLTPKIKHLSKVHFDKKIDYNRHMYSYSTFCKQLKKHASNLTVLKHFLLSMEFELRFNKTEHETNIIYIQQNEPSL